MRAGFYPRLAKDSIRKNKRLYFPYILTGSVMVMMYYILSFLIESPSMEEMMGGSSLVIALSLGCVVIAVFSLLFLFYTNSFLIRQRYQEFGLYNILGMDKKNICKIMLWESIFVAVLVISTGIAAGIAMSKAAELALVNLLHMDVSYELSIGVKSLWQTALIYGGIYLLLFLFSVVRVGFAKPLELVQSNKVGERVLKRTWIFALAGIVCLAAAYYLAVSIEEPLTALLWFFAAVILVIIGTYLILISGSVAFCKLLQSNKAYYYKPNHFVSVSSMVYRMKRNGAGLASICILLTMALVMITSTTSLYIGAEDSLRSRYPSGVNVSVTYDDIAGISEEYIESLRTEIREYSGEEADIDGVRSCQVPGWITKEGIIIDPAHAVDFTALSYDDVGYLTVISLEDYNHMMGTDQTLAEKECLIYCDRLDYRWETFTMEYGETYQVKEQLEAFPVDGDSFALAMPTVFLIVSDLETYIEPVRTLKNSEGESMMTYNWRCGFDMDSAEAEREAASGVQNLLWERDQEEGNGIYGIGVYSRSAQRESFYELFGSLFFLGIMLSIVFSLAAVLIIYYKQISEGYEDQQRFDIMQKVGMTKRDIRRSINSQMLIVFFLPLVLAGIHLSFAFPFVMRIFRLFGFDNVKLSILVNAACFAVFGVLYAVVYKITSGAYYHIVSVKRKS